ncbi:MAG: hypothetical protein HYU97_05300 [Deltaproteobacteria bacterium]|nr:hypothetical protein [Deltaproteobacteria bacterium]
MLPRRGRLPYCQFLPFLFLLILFIGPYGCGSGSNEPADSDPTGTGETEPEGGSTGAETGTSGKKPWTYHPENWADKTAHPTAFASDPESCKTCHGNNYDKVMQGKSCYTCHNFPHNNVWKDIHGQQLKPEAIQDCQKCHVSSNNVALEGTPQSCNSCHDKLSCLDCHDQAKAGRRKIVGPGGDFSLGQHHASGEVNQETCLTCHYMNDHWSGVVKLKDPDAGVGMVYNFNPQDPESVEAFCVNCHDQDGATAHGGLTPFNDGKTVPNIKGVEGSLWADSAHNQINYQANSNKPLSCLGDGIKTGCHSNGHGSDIEKMLSVAGPINNLCDQCHTDEKVLNQALSGNELANNIQQAFSLEGDTASMHNLGTQFTINAGDPNEKTFTLQCTTCHNPHVVTGKYWDAEAGKSPITRPDLASDPTENPRAMGDTLWGVSNDQKMSSYAGVALASSFNQAGNFQDAAGGPGNQLPDYVTFCTDCHAEPGPSPFGLNDGPGWDDSKKSWDSDPHGRYPANLPASKCPNDPACGDATEGWPKTPLGKGFMQRLLPPYDQGKRIAGFNYVLSCTDCHEAHGSVNKNLIRSNLNGTSTPDSKWNNLCLTCHKVDQYMISMSGIGQHCESCHGYGQNPPQAYMPGSIHGMEKNKNGDINNPNNTTLIFNSELVAYLRFDRVNSNNPNLNLYALEDSGHYHQNARGFDLNSPTDDNTTHVDVNFGHLHVLSQITQQCVALGALEDKNAYGCSVNLDGQNDYLELGVTHSVWPPSVFGPHQFFEMKNNASVMAWVFPNVAPIQNFTILSNASEDPTVNYSLYLIPDGEAMRVVFKVAVGNNTWRGACSNVAIPANGWSHVGATFDGDAVQKIKIYINGVQSTAADPNVCGLLQPNAQETQIQAGQDEATCVPFTVGASSNEQPCIQEWPPPPMGAFNWNTGSNFFNGRIDEVKVYNTTQEDFQSLMAPPLPPPWFPN